MSYSIIGSGAIGNALAGHFASKGIEVLLANSRGPAAAVLASSPLQGSGRRVIFTSSDNVDAGGAVAALCEQLDFHPIGLGGYRKVGVCNTLEVPCRDRIWSGSPDARRFSKNQPGPQVGTTMGITAFENRKWNLRRLEAGRSPQTELL